jgi:hypothetical protein
MPERESKARTCDLNLALYRYGGIDTSYDAKAGLRRQMVLSGRIDDSYVGGGPDFSDPRFQGKPVRLEISSPPDPKWLSEALNTPDVGNVCGLVLVNAGVEPKQFEFDGEVVEEEPVKPMLTVDADALEAIRRQAAEAYDHRRIMWATVTLVGEPLPETRSAFIFLKDLDVSKRQTYAVGCFRIFDTRYTDRLCGRVLPVERGPDEGFGTSISILLTEARYTVSVELGLVHLISCEGRVVGGRGKPYDSADVNVEFDEYQPNTVTGKLPEKALSGEFVYWAKRPDEKDSFPHFWFHLMHVPEDARGLLTPLLTQPTETEVILTVSVKNKEGELLAATDELRGNVWYYGFEVRRHLIGDST